MNILIFEDEKPTALRLKSLLTEIDKSIKIIDIIGKVKEGVKWFSENEMPDLIFQDIQLSDGNCFDIFDAVEITAPVIFTTAFSKYAIDSFRVNSIDYIIKPYDKNEIESALDKFERIRGAFSPPEKELLKDILKKNAVAYKKRFLVKKGDVLFPVSSDDIAYLISEDGVTFATLFNKERYIVNYSIVELAKKMDPNSFFQVNRKMIVNIKSVNKINTWFNSRLKLSLNPASEEDVVVSRDRAGSFKEWLDI